MFTVYDKENKEVKVYDVQRDRCGYPCFLIRNDNQWVYRSAKHYSTEQKREKDAIKKIMCNHNYKAICKNNFQPPYFNDETLYRCIECGHEYWQ